MEKYGPVPVLLYRDRDLGLAFDVDANAVDTVTALVGWGSRMTARTG